MNFLAEYQKRRVFARHVGAILTSVAGLFVVALLLWSIAGFHSFARRSGYEAQISVEQLEGRRSWRVKGTMPAGLLLDVGAGNTVLAQTPSAADGSFDAEIEPNAWAKKIWVRSVSPSSGEEIRVEAPLNWRAHSFAPALDVCLYFEDEKALWIAGTATPYDAFTVKGVPPDNEPRAVVTDELGILDALLPVEDGASVIDPRVTTTADVRSPHIACGVVAHTDTPPLARTVVLSEPNLVDLLSTYRRSLAPDRWMPQLMEAMFPEATFAVTLPASHPLLRWFTQGGISAADFLRASIGSLDVLMDDETVERVRVQIEASQSGLRVPDTLATRRNIRIQGQVATVELTMRTFNASLSRQLHLTKGPGNGIAARPLFTPHDRVTIRIDNRWRYDTLPSELKDGAATWYGPFALDVMVSPPVSPTEMQQLLRTQEERGDRGVEPTNIRAFLADFETVRQEGFVSRLWRTVLLLIPIAAMWWILRADLLSSTSRGALLALTLLFGATLGWRFVFSTALDAIPPVMRALSVSVQAVVGGGIPDAATSRRILEQLGDVPDTVSWMVFALLIGLAPFYFSSLSQRLSEPSESEAQAAASPTIHTRSVRLLKSGRIVLSIGILVLVFGAGYAAPLPATRLFLDRHLFTTAAWHTAASVPTLLFDFNRFVALLVPLLWTLLMFCFGFTGILFGVACIGAMSYIYTAGHTATGEVILVLLALSAVPVLNRMLRRILGSVLGRSTVIVALGFALVFIFAARAPRGWVLIASAVLLGVGFLWIIASSLGAIGPAVNIRNWMDRFPWNACVLFAVIGVVIGWPFVPPEGSLRITDIGVLVDRWDDMFPSILGATIALMIWEHMSRTRSQVLSARALQAGMILYAAFLIGPTSTWLFVPVAFLIAMLIAPHWLFKTDVEREALQATASSTTGSAVVQFVEMRSLRDNVEAAVASLRSDFQKAQMVPEEFTKKLQAYREFEKSASAVYPAASLAPFAVGDPEFPHNVLSFLQVGLLLASVPLIISLYEYLPVSRVSYPFSIAGFVIFVVLATLKWALFAAFFGLLFPNLRGDTGLAKGVLFFLVLGIPVAVPYLLGAPTLHDARAFSLWLGQLFVFCSLVGLFAGDLRLLRKNGLRARDLRAVHRVPVLSAFASTVAAAVVPTVLTVLAGKIGDVVKVFIDLVSSGTKGP
jgi:hypothetical protein